MIFYFSGNGNSRWVAEQLAAATHDRALNISHYLSANLPDEAYGADRIGIVFPIHSWRAPMPVFTFLSRLHLPKYHYRYAVCTCGDDAGKAMSHLSKHFPLDAAWSVTMPNTYIPMFNLDNADLARQKVSEARRQIPVIADAVNKHQSCWQVHEGGAAWLKSYVVHPLFVRFVVRSDKFHTDNGCTSCGVCVKRCPVGNISLPSGKPAWGNECIHCMACVHGCPQGVIQYGRVTQKRGRYRLGDFL